MVVPQPPSSFSLVARWVGTHLLPVLSVVGVVVYAVLRVSYGIFYNRFGLEPEEVGIGQAQVLAQSALLLFEYVVVVGAFMTLGYFALRALGAVRPHRVPRGAPLWRRAVGFTQTPYWMIVLPTTIFVGALLVFALPDRARSLADKVKRGETVRAASSFSPRSFDLHVKALPADLTSLCEDRRLQPGLNSRERLRYLGQEGGTLVLFDLKSKNVMRLRGECFVLNTSA